MADQTYLQERWSLADLFSALDAPEVQEARDDIEKSLEGFEGYREKLAPQITEDEFIEILRAYERIFRLLSRLSAYGSLRFSEDTQDQAAQAFQAQAQQLSALADNRTLFLKLWWKSLETDHAKRLMNASGDYRYWLEALRLQKPYTLTEPEE